MEQKLSLLLEENRKVINDAKVQIDFNEYSIDIMLVDEEGYALYGNKFHSAHQAYEFLDTNECLIDG